MEKTDYYNALNKIFSDASKFKKIDTGNDMILTRLGTVQRYLNKLHNRKEISAEDKYCMRPLAANPARAHGLPKIHKKYTGIPQFRPIIDTKGTPDYGISKFLSQLLYPLAQNTYTVKDSFDVVNRIHSIPKHLFDEGYRFVSFDVVSLFTNVPLRKTIEIILQRIYRDKLLHTTICKRSMKKLLLDSCQKTIFDFNGNMYKQLDGVSMGSCLGPVLANIIMTELEKDKVKHLINDKTVPFYARFVDDTLALIKPEDINKVLEIFNSFHPNLVFTVDTFSDHTPHFLDINILTNSETDIYRKPTFSGQFIHFSSFTPWNYKISWARNLIHRSKIICSNPQLFQNQITNIKRFMSWNGFPRYIRNSLCKKFVNDCSKKLTRDCTGRNVTTLWFNVQYLGKDGQFMLRKCIKKLKRCFKIDVPVVFKITHRTNKLAMFCSNKSRLLPQHKSHVVYNFICPGCSSSYIGKTDRNLITRLEEHSKPPSSSSQYFKGDDSTNKSAVNFHLRTCPQFLEIVNQCNLPVAINNENTYIDLNKHIRNTVINNTSIIATEYNWSNLCFLESFYIKKHRPSLNTGIKASKELRLF